MKMFQVGGSVRDELMGIKSKDIDFAVEAESFEAMRAELVELGFFIFVETPEFFTIRAHFPKDHELHGRTTADFTLCRRDGFSSDNRRPDEVFPGTLMDDLARRDFTMNAIAKAEDGTLIDPFDGRGAIRGKLIQFVGEPMERIREDALRAVRCLRFMITKGFDVEDNTWDAVFEDETARLVSKLSMERIRDELHKMFLANTLAAGDLIFSEIGSDLRNAILRKNTLKLLPTMGSKLKG